MVTYLVRSPLSLARMTRGTDEGSIVYRAEKTQCRRFPQAADEDLRTGPHRNFQVFGLVRSSASSRLTSGRSSRRFSAGTRAERWSTASGRVRCVPWPTPAPRRNEAPGRTELSRASYNWSSIPNSSDSSGVSQPYGTEKTSNFLKGTSLPRGEYAPNRGATGADQRQPKPACPHKSREKRDNPPCAARPELSMPQPSVTCAAGSARERPDRETNRLPKAAKNAKRVCERARNPRRTPTGGLF